MKQSKAKDLKTAIKRMCHLTTELYDLMESGMTIDFTMPKKKSVEPRRLIVTKPVLLLSLEPDEEKSSR